MSDFRKVCPQCDKTFQDEDALEILTECPDDGTMLVFDAIDPVVGTKLADRYMVEALIGRGATSTVYRAIDTTDSHWQSNPAPLLESKESVELGSGAQDAAESNGSRPPNEKIPANGKGPATGAVAVKVLHPHLSGDAAVVKRLSQEAKSLRDFSHKSVVSVISLGVTRQGQPFLVMEMVEGQSLLEYMRQNGALNNQLSLSIFDQILDAVGAAHRRGILHRDLKPGNIMLTQDGESGFHVKLLDFGIAKIVPLQGDTFFRLTQTGEMMGSLLYMSPEQCLEQDWDQRGDIYSLGCVFYEALTARAPLIGRTAFETMNKHLSEIPPPLSAVRPDLQFARGIEHLVLKMLEKDPLKRYQTAEEVRADLKIVVEGKGASLLNPGQSKVKGAVAKIGRLALGKETNSADAGTSALAEPTARSDVLAEKIKYKSRQRMLEVGIFVLLMVIWSVPLLFAFAASPNALISACLFGVLLPFLAAVSAMVVVRLPRVGHTELPLLISYFTPRKGHYLPKPNQTGSLLLGSETTIWSRLFGGGAQKLIEPFQRVHSLPFFLVGKESTGKTRLLASLAINELDDSRRAQFIFSPDGELASLVTHWIASHPQGKTLARRVLLIDLDQEVAQVSLAEAYGFSAVQEVSERIVAAMKGGENGSAKEVLTSEQAYILQASVSLLLAANETLGNLPDFLTKEEKRKEIFDKVPKWQGSGKNKDPLASMRSLILDRLESDWDELTKPLLSMCYRFPLDCDAASLRIFWQYASLIGEVINKRKVMIVKGAWLKECSLVFRLVFNEILKERRPSARLSEAENYPVVYIDDVEKCGISDRFGEILGAPTDTGIEFLLSAKTLSIFSDDELARLFNEIGALGIFAVSEQDAVSLKPVFASGATSSRTILGNIDKDIELFRSAERLEFHEELVTTMLPNLPHLNYVYVPKALGDRPVRLLAPFVPKIRITEVEWSIVESMHNGWVFNL